MPKERDFDMSKRVYAENMPREMTIISQRFNDPNLGETMEEVGILLQEGMLTNFQNAIDSDGTGWPDRVNESELSHPKLIDTGALLEAAIGQHPASIRRQALGGSAIEVGVDKSVRDGGIPGAAAHNFGYPEGNLPQREWLYASEEILDACAEKIAEMGGDELFA
jgi:hypothetical protein